jgi:fatty acid desaturase
MPYDATPRPTGLSPERIGPTPEQLRHLRATDAAGLLHVVIALSSSAIALTAAALFLADLASGWIYAAAQLLLAPTLVLWFVILHEAGHGTLFQTRRLNVVAGHLASIFVGIPFQSWKAVHRLHHKWTGWQDIDPTTAALVPRALKPFERFAINTAWRTGFPLFSLLYRARNFWHLPRLSRLLPRGHAHACARNALLLAGVLALLFTALALTLGALETLALVGPGLFLSLVVLDPIMLSQHTHVPLKLSEGEKVKPIKARDQDIYTRSLVFPTLLSRWVLLGFDAHELHHIYPQVPGHLLRTIARETPNAFAWWPWLRAVKRLKGETFLFSNRDVTGADV